MTRVHQESMINLHHNRSSDVCHKKSLFPCLFPYHVLAIIISYIPLESLKSRNLSCENHFEIAHCVTIEMVLQNVLAVSCPLAGVSYYKMYYGVLESKFFIILTKYISLERSESYFVIDVILREKLIGFVTEMHKKNQMEYGWQPGGCFWYNAETKLHKNLSFFISTSNLELNLC